MFFHVARTGVHTSSAEPLLPRNVKLHQDFLENFSRGTMASLIPPEKSEVKWHGKDRDGALRRPTTAQAIPSAANVGSSIADVM